MIFQDSFATQVSIFVLTLVWIVACIAYFAYKCRVYRARAKNGQSAFSVLVEQSVFVFVDKLKFEHSQPQNSDQGKNDAPIVSDKAQREKNKETVILFDDRRFKMSWNHEKLSIVQQQVLPPQVVPAAQPQERNHANNRKTQASKNDSAAGSKTLINKSLTKRGVSQDQEPFTAVQMQENPSLERRLRELENSNQAQQQEQQQQQQQQALERQLHELENSSQAKQQDQQQQQQALLARNNRSSVRKKEPNRVVVTLYDRAYIYVLIGLAARFERANRLMAGNPGFWRRAYASWVRWTFQEWFFNNGKQVCFNLFAIGPFFYIPVLTLFQFALNYLPGGENAWYEHEAWRFPIGVLSCVYLYFLRCSYIFSINLLRTMGEMMGIRNRKIGSRSIGLLLYSHFTKSNILMLYALILPFLQSLFSGVYFFEINKYNAWYWILLNVFILLQLNRDSFRSGSVEKKSNLSREQNMQQCITLNMRKAFCHVKPFFDALAMQPPHSKFSRDDAKTSAESIIFTQCGSQNEYHLKQTIKIVQAEEYTAVRLNLITRSWLLRVASSFMYANVFLQLLFALGYFFAQPITATSPFMQSVINGLTQFSSDPAVIALVRLLDFIAYAPLNYMILLKENILGKFLLSQ